MTKQALFSVTDMSDLGCFAETLRSAGWEIIATGEACRSLNAEGISAQDVSDFTGADDRYGFPPTLHPKMEAALTSPLFPNPIELVYDIPYSLETGNDVGGRTLLALAAKGGRIPVFTREDMREVCRLIAAHGDIPDTLRQQLIDKANAHIAAHFLELIRHEGDGQFDGIFGRKLAPLLNGENPYQVPADLFASLSTACDPLAIHRFARIAGESLCFTNTADLDCILTTLGKLAEAFRVNCGKEPYITVAAKHGNPCGLAVDWMSPQISLEQALWGNPQAIWGGEVITNFQIDRPCAEILLSSREREKRFRSGHWMLDLIASPGFDEAAVEILGRRAQRKLMQNPALETPSLPYGTWTYREVRGGFIRQPQARYILNLDNLEWQGARPVPEDIPAILIAWAVAYTANLGGNEVALAMDRRLLSVGGGPSTIIAVQSAVDRARDNGYGGRDALFAADAFFPHRDAPERLVDAGCRGGVVPGGGIQEHLIREFFEQNGTTVGYLPEPFRGFCRH